MQLRTPFVCTRNSNYQINFHSKGAERPKHEFFVALSPCALKLKSPVRNVEWIKIYCNCTEWRMSKFVTKEKFSFYERKYKLFQEFMSIKCLMLSKRQRLQCSENSRSGSNERPSKKIKLILHNAQYTLWVIYKRSAQFH